MKNKPLILISLISLLFISLSSCVTYKLDIQQGNAISEETTKQLRIGMTPEEVKAIVGTPLLHDDFQQQRWDYVFYLNKAGKQVERKDMVLFFENNKLARIQK